MSRAVLILAGADVKARAHAWIDKAPWNSRVTFQGPRRSLPQNDKAWAIWTDIAQQKDYHGLKLSPADWRLIFLDALKREVRMVPNLDGNGMVGLGASSSDLSKQEFSDLLEIMHAWCAANNVVLNNPTETGE